MEAAVDFVPSIAMGIGLSASAGLRAWLPLLLAGLLSRAGLLSLGPSFGFLGSNQALLLFAIATCVEIVGDKVPAVDHALDAISTVLRPAAGAMLAASAFWQISDPLTAWTLGVAIGAPSALVPHAAKSALRVASTSFTAGLANPLISAVEDATAVVLFALAVLVPLMAAVTVCVVGLLVLRLWRRRAAPPALHGNLAPLG